MRWQVANFKFNNMIIPFFKLLNQHIVRYIFFACQVYPFIQTCINQKCYIKGAFIFSFYSQFLSGKERSVDLLQTQLSYPWKILSTLIYSAIYLGFYLVSTFALQFRTKFASFNITLSNIQCIGCPINCKAFYIIIVEKQSVLYYNI